MKRHTSSAEEIAIEPKRVKSVFPLDQNRRYLGSYVKDGYLHKRFELTNPLDETDKIEIECVTNDTTDSRPGSHSLYPLDQHRKLIREEQDDQGYFHRHFQLENPSDPSDVIEVEYVSNIPRELYETAEQNKKFISEVVHDGFTKQKYQSQNEDQNWDLEFVVKDPSHPEKERKKVEEQQNVIRTRIVGRISLSPRFRALLNDTTASSISENAQNLITLDRSSTLGEAFKKLTDHDILCLPIVEDSKFIGLVDILDILSLLCSKISHESGGILTSKEQWETWHALQELSEVSCVDAANHSGRNPKVEVSSTASLQSVVDVISKNQVHRVGVVSPEGKVEKLLTQFQVLRYLHKHDESNDMGNISTMPLEQLLLGYRDVITAPAGIRTLEAFKTILEHNISGLGIVDDDGAIIGNLSASDLKDIGYNNILFGNLYLPVSEFLKQKLDGSTVPPPLTVTPKTTVAEVLEKFCANRVHRLYISEGSKLLGVITPLDIIECFRTQGMPH